MTNPGGSSENIDVTGSYIVQALDDLAHDLPLSGVPYTNILLSGEGISDAYDPDVGLEREVSVLFFPAGDPQYGHRIASVIHGGAERVDVQQLREQTLRLRVGAVALARTHPVVRQAREQFDAKARLENLDGISATITLCEGLAVPLSVIDYRRVRRSAVLPIGSLAAVLYHPVFIHPKPALRHLQQGVRAMIANETL